jgi:hypothetical protein
MKNASLQIERPLAERQYEALRQGVAKLPSGTTAYLALPGDMLTLRVLELPFADARKIDQVVGYEMEGQIIHELHDVILDHVVLVGAGQGRGDATSGCRALVVAARIEDVRGFLGRRCSRAMWMRGRSSWRRLLYRPQTPGRRLDDAVRWGAGVIATSVTAARICVSSSVTKRCRRVRSFTAAKTLRRACWLPRRARGRGTRRKRARRKLASWRAASARPPPTSR